MYYLIAIPIILVAAIVNVVSKKFKLKIFTFISKLVIIVGVLFFIYTYAKYYGIDIFEYIVKFFSSDFFKL